MAATDPIAKMQNAVAVGVQETTVSNVPSGRSRYAGVFDDGSEFFGSIGAFAGIAAVVSLTSPAQSALVARLKSAEPTS